MGKNSGFIARGGKKLRVEGLGIINSRVEVLGIKKMEIEHSRYQKNGNWTFSEKKLRLAACLSLNSLKAAGNLVGLLKYSNLNQLFPQRTYLKRELLISVNQKFYNTYNLRILELYVQFPQNISRSIPVAKRWRTYNYSGQKGHPIGSYNALFVP